MDKNMVGRIEWLQKVPDKKTLEVREYLNTDFVLVLLDKQLYNQLKEICKKEHISVDDAIYTGILYVKKRLGGE